MAQALFRKALTASLGFTHVNGFYIDGKAAEVIRDLRTSARSLADDVGLVHEQQLVAILQMKNGIGSGHSCVRKVASMTFTAYWRCATRRKHE